MSLAAINCLTAWFCRPRILTPYISSFERVQISTPRFHITIVISQTIVVTLYGRKSTASLEKILDIQ